MNERFGDWLRDTMADVDDGILKRRWSGVESLARDLDDSDIMDILLYTTSCPPRNADVIQRARRAFWDHDNAFRMEGNDLELRRLCGAVVIHILHGESPQRLRLALASVCLHFGNSRHDFGWSTMCQEAEGVLRSLSLSMRSADAEPEAPANRFPQNRAAGRLKKLTDEGHDTVPIPELQELLTQFHKDLKQLAVANRALRTALAIQKEETDILWWLMGGYSNDLREPFHRLPRPVAALVAGKELADHILHRPGPLSVEAILHRALQNNEGADDPVSLPAALKMLPGAWKEHLAAELAEEALSYCPLLAAISYSVTVDDEATWATLFSKHFPHPPGIELAPAVLALHMFRERTLSLELDGRR